jgi:hypothetical protein
MADDSGGGGSGFMGVIVGALLIAVIALGVFAYTGGLGGNTRTAEIKIEAPEVPTGNNGG